MRASRVWCASPYFRAQSAVAQVWTAQVSQSRRAVIVAVTVWLGRARSMSTERTSQAKRLVRLPGQVQPTLARAASPLSPASVCAIATLL